jgi:hypothetical protein
VSLTHLISADYFFDISRCTEYLTFFYIYIYIYIRCIATMGSIVFVRYVHIIYILRNYGVRRGPNFQLFLLFTFEENGGGEPKGSFLFLY